MSELPFSNNNIGTVYDTLSLQKVHTLNILYFVFTKTLKPFTRVFSLNAYEESVALINDEFRVVEIEGQRDRGFHD